MLDKHFDVNVFCEFQSKAVTNKHQNEKSSYKSFKNVEPISRFFSSKTFVVTKQFPISSTVKMSSYSVTVYSSNGSKYFETLLRLVIVNKWVRVRYEI